MSNHLDKAKAALTAAADLGVDLSSDKLPPLYSRLLDLAMVQAQVATAEALEALAPGPTFGGPR
jgi:hypothetical protein